MDGPCDQLLAGAAFTKNQNIDVRRGDLVNGFLHLHHHLALPDDGGNLPLFFDGFFEFDVFKTKPPL